MYNLYYIESPFQLFGAFENICKSRFDYKIIIRLNENSINNEQIKIIAEKFNLKNVNYIYLNKKKSFKDYYNLLKLIINIIVKDYNKIYVGNYNSILFQIIKLLIDNTKFILLDDGVGTLTTYDILKKNNKQLELFTLFNLQSTSNISVVVHNFSNLVKFFSSSEYNSYKNIFIGTQFVRYGFLDEVDYIMCIKESIKILDGDTILYFPHRNESKELINKISMINNVIVIKASVPIEYYLLNNNISPYNVFTVFSTAIFSLKVLYKDIEIYVLKPTIKEHIEKNDLLLQYDFLESMKEFDIKMVKINN